MIAGEKDVEMGLYRWKQVWVTHQSFQFISQTAERIGMLLSQTERGSIWLQTTKHGICMEKQSKAMWTSMVPSMQPRWSRMKELTHVKLQPRLHFLTHALYGQVWSV